LVHTFLRGYLEDALLGTDPPGRKSSVTPYCHDIHTDQLPNSLEE